ncbi:TIGR02099 family protein [Halopseudomonas xinjiangensis]|uniref:TIGR02099 family protein n=1 Tax=Halopseudomonas xinjiangensis TaxID=487184 RepID=A0A1H1VVV4_9GAMM|nr:YhdP family protein [Halopseudomonas xinjiangensis]SDS88912.1 TIGR02099 family protein [Halopseudomonas xinjiangensis]
MSWQGALRRTLNVVILALAAWLLLTALYVSFGRLLVPIVADYREQLVARVEQSTGRAITLEKLSGEMQGAQPVFTLRGLTVHETLDSESPVLLALDHVVARLDLFASLWRRQPVMDALQLEGLSLEIAQAEDGRWTLKGLGRREAEPLVLQDVADTLFRQRRITLLDSHIRIQPQALPAWSFDQGALTLLNGPDWHRLDGRLSLPDGEQVRWQVNGASRGSGSELDQLTLGFFLDIPVGDWSQWLPQAWLDQARISNFAAGGRFWGSWGEGRLQRLQGEMVAPAIEARPAADGTATIENLYARFAAQLSGDVQRLDVERFRFRMGEHRWPAMRLQASRSRETDQWELRADRLVLARLAELMLPYLPERYAEIVRSLDPVGEIRQLRVQGSADRLEGESLQVEARLKDVGAQPWEGIPGFSGISGYMLGSPAAGELRLAATDWSMHLPRLFERPWHYQSLTGALNWRWGREEGLTLDAPGLGAIGPAGRAAVKLQLKLPPQREDASMDLDVALRDIRAAHYAEYLPTRAPAFNPRLGEWLSGTELDGEVPLAVFGYHGSLRAGAPAPERDIKLYAELREGHLIAQPGWPVFESVNGTLRLHNQNVVVEQGSAKLWNTRIEDVEAVVGRAAPEQSLHLGIQGNLSGRMEDALRFLQQAPLGERAGDMFEGWSGAGDAYGRIQLGLDLKQGAQPRLAVDFSTSAAQLSVPALQTELGSIAGDFSYVHGRGLTASDVSLRMLGEPVEASVASESMVHSLSAAGSHGLDALREWPLLSAWPADVGEGRLEWEAQASLSPGEQVIDISSDLVGVDLDLPPPFTKPADSALPSRLLITRSATGQRWLARAGEDTYALFETDGETVAGELSHGLGEPAQIAGPGLGISARLEELDLQAWRQWLASVGQGSDADGDDSSSTAPPSVAPPLNRLDIATARFAGFGLELDDLALLGERSSQGDWQLKVEQAEVEGHIMLPASPVQPMVIALDRLRLPRADTVPDDGTVLVEPLAPRDVLADIRPSQLRPFDFGVSRLSWGDDEVGSLAFVLRPSIDGAHLNDVSLDLRGGLRLDGDLFWGETVTRTRFTGQLQAADLGEVLRTWEYAPTLTSKEFEADVDLDWPGSPALFAFKRSTGLLTMRARDGMLKSGEGSADALRVFGLLNFNALTRRLRLDFSDLFGRGTAYDTLDADLALTNGVMQTRTPLLMEGPSAKVQLDGHIDLPQNQIDMGMLVTLPLTNNLPLAAIIAGAPHIGGVLFLADKILGDKVARFASVKYRISGDWQQPTVEFDRAFDDKPALEESP